MKGRGVKWGVGGGGGVNQSTFQSNRLSTTILSIYVECLLFGRSMPRVG